MQASDKFMLVYASNQPEQFDWAINDRIDEVRACLRAGTPSCTELLVSLAASDGRIHAEQRSK